MSKKEELAKLFEQWRSEISAECFIRDGIVQEENFDKSAIKVLFVLKESPEEPGQGKGWCLADLMRKVARREESHSNFGGKLALWSYSLLNGLPHWEDVKKKWEDPSKQREVLQSLLQIAVMNTKKVPGGKSSEDEKLKTVLEHEGEWIKKEVQIIAPDVVVCCGVWHLWKEMLGVTDSQTLTSPNGFQWFELSLEDKVPRKFLCFPHPSRPLENAIMYSFYIDGIRQSKILKTSS